ncbi:MAG: winged helix DNA-binding protein [Acidilobaceae archaeon]|nr:winged helix DNA-binding protein [Acidilobaceae archaeon]
MKKRGRLRIIIEVLSYIAEESPVPATRVAQATGLAYDRLAALLEELNEKGLVKLETGERLKRVSITKKGLETLRKLRELRDFLEDLGLGV